MAWGKECCCFVSPSLPRVNFDLRSMLRHCCLRAPNTSSHTIFYSSHLQVGKQVRYISRATLWLGSFSEPSCRTHCNPPRSPTSTMQIFPKGSICWQGISGSILGILSVEKLQSRGQEHWRRKAALAKITRRVPLLKGRAFSRHLTFFFFFTKTNKQCRHR